MGRKGHRKGSTGGAFGKGGSDWGLSGSRGRIDKPTYRGTPTRDAQQKRYTQINIGDKIEIHSAEASRSGNDLTKAIGPYRIFITKEQGMNPGWSGTVEIKGQNEQKPNLYYATPCKESAKPEPVKAAADTIEAKFEQKGPAEYAAKPGEERETILIGDLGGTKRDSAVVYVDAKSRGMPILQALEYLIRNGTATSSQGQSILEAMRAHLDSGRPLYEVAGTIPDSKMTLGHYLDEWKQKEPLDVEVGEKAEKVKIPAAVDIIDKKKTAVAATVPVIAERKRKAEPMPVGAGGRRGGASLESLTSSYQIDLYQK